MNFASGWLPDGVQLGMYIPSPTNKHVFLVGTGACVWGVLTCLFVVSRYRGPTIFFACGALRSP